MGGRRMCCGVDSTGCRKLTPFRGGVDCHAQDADLDKTK